MQDLNNLLQNAFVALDLPLDQAKAVISSRPDLCDYQCNSAMALAKSQKCPPRQLAEKIVGQLKLLIEESDEPIAHGIETLEIAGPGFINITLKNTYLDELANHQTQDLQLGLKRVESPKKILLDFGGPNVAKEMHVGHLRCAIVGESLQRILTAIGHSTISDVHLGDWGLPYGKTIYELSQTHPELPYFDEAIAQDENYEYPSESPLSIQQLTLAYKAGNKRCDDSPEALDTARKITALMQQGHRGYRALWKHFVSVSVEDIKAIYTRLGIQFDYWYGESDAYPYIENVVEHAKAQNLLIQSDGAQVIPVEEEQDGDNPLPPLMVYKSDSAVTYGATDLATIYQRMVDFQPDQILYVVDQRQGLHFKQVFRAADKLAYTEAKNRHSAKAKEMSLTHIGYGTINGSDGKPLKTRNGLQIKLSGLLDDAVAQAKKILPDIKSPECIQLNFTQEKLDQLAESIAIAAIKFNDMKNNTATDYTFDLQQFTRFEGKTGPYIQYAIARIHSMLEKAELKNYQPGQIKISNEFERKLIFLVLQINTVIHKSAENYEPSIICDHVFEIAQAFSRFYSECPALSEPDPEIRASRLAIALLTQKVLAKELDLLGLDAPKKILTRKPDEIAL